MNLPPDYNDASLYEAWFESAPVGVAEGDLQTGRFIRVNPRFAQMLGYSQEELQQCTFADVTHDDDKDLSWKSFREALKGPTNPAPHQKRFIHKDGHEVWGETALAVLRDAQAEPRAVIAVVHDLSHQKAIEDALRQQLQVTRTTEHRFSQLIAHSPLSIQVVSADGRLLAVNKAWERLWGVTLDMVQDFNFHDDPQLKERGIYPFIQRAFNGEAVELPLTVFMPDRGIYAGQDRYVRCVIYPVADEEKIDQIVIVQDDVTDRVHTEAALRSSEARFRAVFENSVDAILVAHGLTIDFVNPACVDLLGYDGPEELVGQDISILLADSCRDSVLLRAKRRLQGEKEPTTYEAMGQTKQGNEIPVELRVSTFTFDGTARQMVIVRDLRPQKKVEEALKQQTKTLELINQIGASLSKHRDLDTLVQDLTNQATELTGAQFGAFFYNVYDNEGGSYMLYTLSGAPRSAFENFPMPRATAVFHPTFAGTEVIRSADITKDPRYGQNDPYFGKPEGHLPVVSYLAVPVKSQTGEVIGGLFFGHSEPGVFSELHERVLEGVSSQAAIAIDNARLYQRLSNMNAELERRVEERTEELTAANQELEGFTYSVSHDLRAPLRAIIASSMILREDFANELPEAAASQLNRQAAAAKKMGVLIDELLHLSRLGRQEMHHRRVDLSAMANELTQELSADRPTNVSYEIAPDLEVVGDERLLRLALWNLLDNATKFSPSGGTVTFAKEGEAFVVRDQGIGFDMQYASKLFLPFERLHRDDEFPGTGIGLANVQRIIQRHGGRIWAESLPGKGAAFFFQI